MRITLLAVGRIKEKFYADAVREYEKRLGRYCRLEIIEVPDEKTPYGAGRREEELILQKEGGRLLKVINDRPDAYVAALAIDGMMPDSLEFSRQIEKLGVDGVGHIIFVIGGSLGLSSEVLNRVDQRLSFSRMTFPHQLMRVIFLEQLYRAFRIMKNEPYHK